jgi:PAS domain S-box-containing protein
MSTHEADALRSTQAERDALREQNRVLEQRLAEVQAERDLFRALAEHAPDTISVARLDRTILYANPAFRRSMGYGESLIGMSANELYAEPVEKLADMFAAVAREGFWHGLLTYRRQDESTFKAQVTTFAIRDEQGQTQAMAGIARDVTDRLLMEDMLWENRALLQGLLDYSPSAIFVKDTAGRVVLLNRRYRAMIGLSNEQIVGASEAELFPPHVARARQEADQRVLTSGETVEFEEFIDTPDGLRVGILMQFPIADAQGQLVAIGGIWHDITAIKQAEEENAYLQDQVIVAQHIALRDVSSPLCPLTSDVLLMPLVGAIDNERAGLIMNTLLEGVAANQARIVILDITGVPEMDAQVAAALLRSAQAVRMLGAQLVLTGISTKMAQALVQLGADLSTIITRGSLQGGITYAFGALHRTTDGVVG